MSSAKAFRLISESLYKRLMTVQSEQMGSGQANTNEVNTTRDTAREQSVLSTTTSEQPPSTSSPSSPPPPNDGLVEKGQPIPLIEEEEEEEVEEKDDERRRTALEALIGMLPKSYRRKAMVMMNHGNINFHEHTMRTIYTNEDGTKELGSHLVDLIQSALNPSFAKRKNPPPDLDRFMSMLANSPALPRSLYNKEPALRWLVPR